MANETCLRQMFKTKTPFPNRRARVSNFNCYISNGTLSFCTCRSEQKHREQLIVRWTLPVDLPRLSENVYLSKGQSFLKATSLLSDHRL